MAGEKEPPATLSAEEVEAQVKAAAAAAATGGGETGAEAEKDAAAIARLQARQRGNMTRQSLKVSADGAVAAPAPGAETPSRAGTPKMKIVYKRKSNPAPAPAAPAEEDPAGGVTAEDNATVAKIQAAQRGKDVRKEKQQQDAAAAKIQTKHRGKVARREVAVVKATQEEGEMTAAASKIQSAHRSKKARLLAMDKRVDGLKESVKLIRQKLQAASYVAGGQDWEAMFKFYDRDNEGSLGKDEFISACRRDGKISVEVVSDIELMLLCNFVDKDGSGEINYEEFHLFLSQPVDLAALDAWARAEVKAEADRKQALRAAKANAELSKLRTEQAERELKLARQQIAELEALRLKSLVIAEASARERSRLVDEAATRQTELTDTQEKNRQWQEVAIKRMRISTREKTMAQAYAVWKELWHSQKVEKESKMKMAEMELAMEAKMDATNSKSADEVKKQMETAQAAMADAEVRDKRAKLEASKRSDAEREMKRKDAMLDIITKQADEAVRRAEQRRAGTELKLLGAKQQLMIVKEDFSGARCVTRDSNSTCHPSFFV